MYLFSYIGTSFFASIGVLVAACFINLINAGFIEKYENKYMAAKDKRLDATNETLSNMKCIKMFAWSKTFREKIVKNRRLELRALWIQWLQLGFLITVFYITPCALGLVTF